MSAEQPTPTTSDQPSLTDRIVLAICNPDSVLPREDGETATRWSTRAVERVLRYVAPPDGLDARFGSVCLTVHCSHCGEAYEGEFGPVRFEPEQLHKLGEYAVDDEGWIVNTTGLFDNEFGDRKLVCPNCTDAGWCDVCDEPIRAWQHVANTVDAGVVHEGCVDQATSSGGQS